MKPKSTICHLKPVFAVETAILEKQQDRRIRLISLSVEKLSGADAYNAPNDLLSGFFAGWNTVAQDAYGEQAREIAPLS
jgi:hypothetical protein